MEFATYSARLGSFSPPTKRSKLGWPHTSPKPEDLAKAGFYFKPQGAGSDNTVCFLCERSLDGWEEEDDPFKEHLKHSEECPWAILTSIGHRDVPEDEKVDDPTETKYAEARRATFALGWPHESKRGWVCKTEKMVEAGWHFAPTTESEDFVTCAYCKLSLDGWEPKDNPFDEHYRRSPDCSFFVYAGSTAPSKRPKAKKGRTSKGARSSKVSRASRVSSRLSTQSNMSLVSEITSIPDLDESIDTSTTSIVSTMSTASTATNRGKRKGAGTKTTSKSKKGRTTKSKKGKAEEEEDDDPTEIPLQSQSLVVPEFVIEEKDVVQEPGSSLSIHDHDEPDAENAYSRPKEISTAEIPPDQPAPSAHSEEDQRSLPTPPLKEPSKSATRITTPESPSTTSDIENAPPSTRPTSIRPPITERSQPKWDKIDIDLIFQQLTPEVTDDPIPFPGDMVSSKLSGQEKDMTVQEWIEHIATQAETQLKAEGERVVSIFEREGARAMNVLESIECV